MNTINPSKVFDELNDIINQSPLPKVDNTIDVEEHKCKYCGAMTTQSDDECYAKPKIFPEGTIVRDMYNLAEDEFDKPCYTKLKNGKWQQSKTNTIEYCIYDDSIGEKERFKLISIPPQPKAIEDNVWDEARKGYFQYVSECRHNGVTYLDLFKWLEQHYSLIKK